MERMSKRERKARALYEANKKYVEVAGAFINPKKLSTIALEQDRYYLTILEEEDERLGIERHDVLAEKGG